MQRRLGRNNARSLFGVERIPSDEQIRNLLDPIAPAYLGPPFWAVLERLETAGVLADYHSFNGGLLCSLDGTQYFFHTVLHLWDEKYRRVRAALGTRKTFFDDIRALIRYYWFADWDQLLDFMLAGLELAPD